MLDDSYTLSCTGMLGKETTIEIAHCSKKLRQFAFGSSFLYFQEISGLISSFSLRNVRTCRLFKSVGEPREILLVTEPSLHDCVIAKLGTHSTERYHKHMMKLEVKLHDRPDTNQPTTTT